jgi:protein TonB
MIDWRDPDRLWFPSVSLRVLLRWSAAATLVLAAHAAVVWLAIQWRSAAAAPGEPPPAVMIDLAPLAVAPQAPPQDIAPGPQMTEAPQQASESDPPQQVTADKAEPVLETPEVKPPEVGKSEAEVVLPPPPAKAEAKQKPLPRKKVERNKPHQAERPAAPRTSAPPPSLVQRADRAVAPAAGAASSAAASASWKSELIAHLNRYKRFPAGAVSSGGTATIAFTVNRSGQVLGSRLIHSSGDGVLDAEAVALPRRASPVPPPPAAGGGSIGLAVPIRFTR